MSTEDTPLALHLARVRLGLRLAYINQERFDGRPLTYSMLHRLLAMVEAEYGGAE